MKKVFSAFGLLAVALVILGVPASAQTPGDITATLTTAPSAPTAGQTILVTGQFSIPALSADPATVAITTSGGAAPTIVSFTPGLSSCVVSSTAVNCTWSTPDSASPQTLVISVPAGAGTITFTAQAGAVGSQLVQKATASVTVGQATTTTAAGSTTAATTTVAPTTVAPPPTQAPTTVAPTTTAAGTLPATGSDSQAPLVVALVAIALGAVLVGGARLVKSRA